MHERFTPSHTTCRMFAYLGSVQAVDAGGWVVVCIVEVVYGEAVVVVVAGGVVAAGARHCLLCSSNSQLTKTPLQTAFTSLPAVRAEFQSAQPWGRKKPKSKQFKKYIVK